MAEHLTQNAIHLLNDGEERLPMVLQVMKIRRIGGRFQLQLSDGLFFQRAEVGPWLAQYFTGKNPVVEGTIIKLDSYSCTKTTIFVFMMEVVGATSQIIGDPKEFGEFRARAGGGGQDQPRGLSGCLSYFVSRM